MDPQNSLMKVRALIFNMEIGIFSKIFRSFSETYMHIFGSRFVIRNPKRRLNDCGKDVSGRVDLALSFSAGANPRLIISYLLCRLTIATRLLTW